MMYAVYNESMIITHYSSVEKENSLYVENKSDFPLGENIVDRLKTYLSKKVRKAYQEKVDAFSSLYASYEIESFKDQREEWKLYLANYEANTPVVNAMASARGVTREVLFSKIGENVIALASMQGEQNALEDSIKNATTIAELKAVWL